MELYTRIILIILQSIKYRNKELLLSIIKAELISSKGYITELAMVVNPKKYHSIHKLFTRVKIDIIAIQIEIIVTIIKYARVVKIAISIDDSIVYRSRRKKVPLGYVQYDHSHKKNRSKYVFGQKWLAFGITFDFNGYQLTLPLYIHLVKENVNLISLTIVILRKIKNIITKRGLSLEVEILTDSWFARKRLIFKAKKYGFSIITMARSDLALYEIPEIPKEKKRGRPKIYGNKIKPELEDLTQESTIFIYSKNVKVKYKEEICKARFLGGEIVKAIWIKFDDSKSMRLMISTDITLSAIEIIKRYAKRWDIESMFNELKNRFCFKDIMLHTPKSYYQFFYFKIWCFIIIKVSSINFEDKIIAYVKEMLPWRVLKDGYVKITAGVTKLSLETIFSTLEIETIFPKIVKNKSDNYETPSFTNLQNDMKLMLAG